MRAAILGWECISRVHPLAAILAFQPTGRLMGISLSIPYHWNGCHWSSLRHRSNIWL